MNCSLCGNDCSDTHYHIGGRDYCVNCARDIPRPPDRYTETVRGTIIGDVAPPHYVFITKSGYRHSGNFKNDAAAIEWFRTTYPNEYREGVEMRMYP